jgi:hypothetical protein
MVNGRFWGISDLFRSLSGHFARAPITGLTDGNTLHFQAFLVVLPVGIEPTTSPLPREITAQDFRA